MTAWNQKLEAAIIAFIALILKDTTTDLKTIAI